MRSLFASIHINTGSNALFYGLLAAFGAVALVIGIAEFDLMRPVHHPLSPKLHSEVEYQYGFEARR